MESKKEQDHLLILRAMTEIPFGVGKKLLIDFLQGNEDNKSIKKNQLNKQSSFASMFYDKEELEELIDNLSLNNLIKQVSINNNRFWKVLELTDKGRKELESPSLNQTKERFNFKHPPTIITDEEKQLFKAFGPILNKYNDEQKKAIISKNDKILCIAGAGSGKTTVLTKRIEFLVKYRSSPAEKILAITFTRKARKEMMSRLESENHLSLVQVETFNSFCEKILKKYNNLIYSQNTRVISYRDKIMIVNRALSALNLSMRRAINAYFSPAQRRGKPEDKLRNIFLNDCFFIRDYFKFKNKDITKDSFSKIDNAHAWSANIVLGVCNYIEAFMKKNGLRDFADQLVDTITLFKTHSKLTPEFDHILIDEYQDVNSTQIELIELLNPKNLFCVGDPRQSIYGWRGSDIGYISNFNVKYPNCEIISLSKNYRSSKQIVDLINSSIKKMGLVDLESAAGTSKDNQSKTSNEFVKLLKFKKSEDEYSFLINEIKQSDIYRHEIFVLARTNRQLTKLASMMKRRGIKHIVRNDEMKRSVIAKKGEVTLATVHAIKGLEAELVFVVGCTNLKFPCKGSEHPVVDLVTLGEYDKQEEERRLFYVAMSRAKNQLYLTYTGKKPTAYISKGMLKILGESKSSPQTKFSDALKLKSTRISQKGSKLLTKLKQWRTTVSFSENRPAFMILHDKTLRDIVDKKPKNTKELLTIYGLGPLKIHKYSEDILSIVNDSNNLL